MAKEPIDYTRDQVESWSTSYTVAVGAESLAGPLRARLNRLAAELAKQNSAEVSRGRRDALIRVHDEQFNAKCSSRTKRAKAIERDLRLASATSSPSSPQAASAKIIFDASDRKILGWKQIMNIIQ